MIGTTQNNANGAMVEFVTICDHCEGQVWAYRDERNRVTYVMHDFPVDKWKDNAFPLPTEEHMKVTDLQLALTPVTNVDDPNEGSRAYWLKRVDDWCDNIHAPRTWEAPDA